MTAAPTLLDYQSRWVAETEPVAVCEKSRRIGISWATALMAVRQVTPDDRPANVYYQSYAKDMTSGFIADCRDWAEWYQKVSAEIEQESFREDGRDFQVYRIRATTGKEISAMTSSPRGFRSKGRPGDFGIIDEAAFVDDLGAVLKALTAFRILGGQIRIISTHNGEGSQFATLVKDIREGIRPGVVHTTTFRDALDQGLYRRICSLTGESWSPDREQDWEQRIRAEYGDDAAEELDCVPASGAGHWLAWPLLHAAEHADAGNPDLFFPRNTAYIGVDVARRRDLWVAVVLELVGDVLWVRELVSARNITFAEQDFILDGLVDRYRPVRIKMDQTGMGEKPVEDARMRYGSMRVEGVLMSGPRRLDVATCLRELFEDGRIRIPQGDRELMRDLRSVRTEEAPGGGVRLLAPRTKDDSGDGEGKTHADRFWALALASAAAAGMAGPFDGEAVGEASAVVASGYAGAGAPQAEEHGVIPSGAAHAMRQYH